MWQKEQVIGEFQKNGKRITEQRKMLLDVILEGNWVSCKDIYYEARKRDRKLGMATVYRTVSALEEIGVLSRACQFSIYGDDERNDGRGTPQSATSGSRRHLETVFH